MNKANITSEWENVITELSKNATSVAYGIFSFSEKLIAANKTMCHFLDTNTKELNPKNSLINPDFEKIKAIDAHSEQIFEGILTIGNYADKNFALNAKIFKNDNSYLVFGEADVMTLFEENSKMSRLNQEVNNLQRQLIKKKNELERLNDLKNRFIGIASHDLRNPLNVVDMYAGFLKEDSFELLNEENQDFVNTIQKSARYMINLVEDLLEYSKIEAGNMELKLQKFDLIKAINGIIELHKPIATKKQIAIEVNTTDEELIINADLFKLEQVINNLLNNAVKFAYLESTILVSISAKQNTCEISVSNAGDGIEKHDLENIFKAFHKIAAQGTNREKGSGLGLFIVNQIVNAHKGHIKVSSVLKEQTTFTVSLPLKK